MMLPLLFGTLQTNFSLIDWLIVASYVGLTTIVGLYANRMIKGMDDYIVAGRSLRSSVSVATLIGSELGLVTVLYAAQKGFTSGFAAFHIGVIAGFGALFVGLTGFIVGPLRREGVRTIPEYYGRRFGTPTRVLGGLILAFAGILNMGIFLKAGALFLAELTGLESDATVGLIMSILLGLVLLYTVFGGMVSVVLTDYLQFVVLSVGLLLAAGIALIRIGWPTLVETVKEVHGEAGFDPFDAQGFGPGYVVWMFFVAGVFSCAIWPTAVMRACSAENVAVVRRMYRWSSIGFMIRFIVPQFLGICALAMFWNDPVARPHFFHEDGTLNQENSLGAMPVFLGQLLPIGLVGLIGAGMLAAFMSTHDSYLLCWATVLANDVVSPLTGDRLNTAARLLISRAFIVLIGLFLLIWGLWYPLSQDLWDYMAVTGTIYFSGAFAILVAGLHWRRSSQTGAICALLGGLVAILGLDKVRDSLGLTEERIGFAITDVNSGLGAILLSLVLLVAGSLLFPQRRDKAAPAPSSNQDSNQ